MWNKISHNEKFWCGAAWADTRTFHIEKRLFCCVKWNKLSL